MRIRFSIGAGSIVRAGSASQPENRGHCFPFGFPRLLKSASILFGSSRSPRSATARVPSILNGIPFEFALRVQPTRTVYGPFWMVWCDDWLSHQYRDLDCRGPDRSTARVYRIERDRADGVEGEST